MSERTCGPVVNLPLNGHALSPTTSESRSTTSHFEANGAPGNAVQPSTRARSSMPFIIGVAGGEYNLSHQVGLQAPRHADRGSRTGLAVRRHPSMTAARPPSHRPPFAGTASGKTTVCDMIMQRLNDACVVMLPQDSFYKSLEKEQLASVSSKPSGEPPRFTAPCCCKGSRICPWQRAISCVTLQQRRCAAGASALQT